MKNLNTKEHLRPVDDEVMNAYRDGAEEAVDEIKSSSPNKSVKIALKIISSILFKLVDNHKSDNQTQGEATLIIENIRPFLNHCIISQLEGVKYEWLTYRLALPSDGQIMIPDLALFVEKRQIQNNNLENDLVKLEKEMHTALNKLVKKRVRNPEVVELLIEDTKTIVYKMTLKYEGLYQMIEISQFNFTRDNTDDILLIPAIIRKLSQIKEIVLATISNLYQCIDGDEELVDLTSYTRQVCKTPVPILVE
ncbi:hypothetical protein CU097_008094 [Rhizopus azygosporus]|uniref:Uncharacterized protein n=1 Tax=Rhizopus azygosporus TaxID=86630 RepID=A0A367J736_RHIAZ|nr:hypothetical protein CU097_008094 [Rhizopus azygosporus]